VIDPIARQFDPRFVLVSAGFDAHYSDPLAHMRVTEDGFAMMTRSLLAIARDHAGGRLAAVLEGGYDLNALASSAARVLDELGGGDLSVDGPQGSGADASIQAVTRVHRRFWKL
jgi:acetoin utilization deacetylase AcuC-like enzyme